MADLSAGEALILGAAETAQWLLAGALFAGAIGLAAIASVARQTAITSAWRWLSTFLAIASLSSIVLMLFDSYPADVLLVVLIAGVLLPAWAIWLAIRAGELWLVPAE